MTNPLLRRYGPAALATLLAALVIGCGGGGGGGGKNGSNSTGGTNTSGTTTSSTSGDAATLGGGTDGGSGNLAPNSIYFLVGNGDGYDVRVTSEANPSPTVYATGIPTDAPVATPDPSAAGRLVFAATAANGQIGIYRNTGISLTGATTFVSPQFAEVVSLQVSRDGKRVVLVATPSGANEPRLYTATVGGIPVLLDAGYVISAELGSDGTNVVYEKITADGDTEIFVRDIAATTALQITNDAVDESQPQFSKDGKKVVFSMLDAKGRSSLGTLSAVGGAITPIDPFPGTDVNLYAPSFNSDGTRVAFLAFGDTVDDSGIYTCDLAGGNVSKVAPGDPLPLESVYWTNANGRGPGGLTYHLNRPRKR